MEISRLKYLLDSGPITTARLINEALTIRIELKGTLHPDHRRDLVETLDAIDHVLSDEGLPSESKNN